MKHKEKIKARELREKGKSVRYITKVLNVSKGSVSRWVGDILLTDEQIKKLKKNQSVKAFKGASASGEKAREKRREYQQEGKNLLKKSNKEFIAGIMLYWAEGNKCKNSAIFCNSEPAMMTFFIKFLRRFFAIDEKRFKFCFQWYSNNNMTKEDVTDYWSNLLNISKDQMNKCYIDYRPVKNMGRKKNKCPYGICRLILNDTRVVQMIYGAIQEYIGFKNDRWLF